MPDDHEHDPACSQPGSITPSQLRSLPAWFGSAGIARSQQGQYIYDALRFHGIAWRHGGRLEKLSCRQAGLVLLALVNSTRAPRGKVTSNERR